MYDRFKPVEIFRFGQEKVCRLGLPSPHKRDLFLHPLESVAPLVPARVTRFDAERIEIDYFALRDETTRTI